MYCFGTAEVSILISPFTTMSNVFSFVIIVVLRFEIRVPTKNVSNNINFSDMRSLYQKYNGVKI